MQKKVEVNRVDDFLKKDMLFETYAWICLSNIDGLSSSFARYSRIDSSSSIIGCVYVYFDVL